MRITVPNNLLAHFWEQEPEGHEEFWAFRWPVRANVGDTIHFMNGGREIAQAVIGRIEKPGQSECESTGRFLNMWKVYWPPSSFRDTRGAIKPVKSRRPTNAQAIAADAAREMFGEDAAYMEDLGSK